jgi:predicted nucleic acid-binding protein
MIAIDTSVLAFAVNRYAPEHSRAARVVEELANGDHPWALPWSVVHEFLRLVTHPHVAARALRPSDAWSFAGELIASPTVRLLAPTERHASVLVEVLGMAGEPIGLPAGLETAVLLREHGIRELLSVDRGMRRYAFLTVRDPMRGVPWSPNEKPARRYRVLSSRARGPARQTG